MTKAGVAGIWLTAGVALAACGSGGSSSSTQSSSAPASPAATAASSSAASAPAATSPAASSPAGSASAAAAATCQPAALRVALGAHSGTSQVTQAVDLTNTGSSPCTMNGFPGVDLTGTARGSSSYKWSLTRASQSHSPVTLPPGAAAHFNIVYLPTAAGSTAIDVATVVITPPNDFSSVRLSWSQNILLQDGATHPGTWITPVQSGA